MRGIFAGFAASALLLATPVLAEDPPPQFTVQDLQRDFAQPQEEMTVGKNRGFSLAAPATTSPSAPAAAKGAKPPRPRPGGRQTASLSAPPVPAGRDLLINFANASSTLTAQSKSNARVFAEAANTPQLRSARFAIDGHTNAIGGRDYNLGLSKARAQALVDYLASLGMERSRIDVNGYGFDRLLNPKNPRGPENRRVEARRIQ